MPSTLAEDLEVLERTPAVLDALLRGTRPAWHRADEGPDSWSPFEVVGHLIHAEETNWIPRARSIRDHGEGRAFEPFDRFAHLARFADGPIEDLLDRFAAAREESLATLRGWDLSAEDLARLGRHPEFGAVSLGQLLSTWAVHDLSHLAQVVRAMAKGRAEHVGPWRGYLSVFSR